MCRGKSSLPPRFGSKIKNLARLRQIERMLQKRKYRAKVVIPGGHGPDKLRLDNAMVDFTRRFFDTGKPLVAICHGPQLLIEAGVVK
jgi:putative intracellular protease/amidase